MLICCITQVKNAAHLIHLFDVNEILLANFYLTEGHSGLIVNWKLFFFFFFGMNLSKDSYASYPHLSPSRSVYLQTRTCMHKHTRMLSRSLGKVDMSRIRDNQLTVKIVVLWLSTALPFTGVLVSLKLIFSVIMQMNHRLDECTSSGLARGCLGMLEGFVFIPRQSSYLGFSCILVMDMPSTASSSNLALRDKYERE